MASHVGEIGPEVKYTHFLHPKYNSGSVSALTLGIYSPANLRIQIHSAFWKPSKKLHW